MTEALPEIHNAGNQPRSPFSKNMVIMCRHKDGIYYEGKVINVTNPPDGETVYTVHYKGWGKKYDEKIHESELIERYMEYTPENAEMYKSLYKSKLVVDKSKDPTKKSRRSTGTPGGTSRGTTPSLDRSRRSSTERQSVPSALVIPVQRQPSVSTTPNRRVIKVANVKQEKFMAELPHQLWEVLELDREKLDNGFVLKLPGKFTIADCIEDYANNIGKPFEQPLSKNDPFDETPSFDVDERAVTSFIRDVFDVTLRTQLLYNAAERAQMDVITQREFDTNGFSEDELEEMPFRYSNVYGFVHLLRCLVKLRDFMGYISNQEDYLKLKTSIFEKAIPFTKFLADNWETYFESDNGYVTSDTLDL